ncbi:S46 family peptidase [Rhizobium rhizosphaerae]|nr:S46 family peptidase [Xaviernesmea rhizosphaerae]
MLSVPILFALSSVAYALTGSVDGSSKENYEKSLKAMADQLSSADKEVFSKGLINLMITRYPPAAGAEGLMLLQFMPQAIEAAPVNMNGVTADEIMARGRELVAQARAAGALTTPPDANGTLACVRKKVAIASATFEKGDYSLGSRFSVTNNLPYAIAGIWIDYKIKSDNRSVPWAEEDFVMAISGGIEPGETRQLSTSFSLLSRETPMTAKVFMTVRDVADPDKKLVVKAAGGVSGWPTDRSPKGCQL